MPAPTSFIGTGVHVLRGIEIYKGRPIFYGLGEFFRQMDVVGLSGMGGRGRGDENSPPIKYESVVAHQPVRSRSARPRSGCIRSSSPTTSGWRIAVFRAWRRRRWRSGS